MFLKILKEIAILKKMEMFACCSCSEPPQMC